MQPRMLRNEIVSKKGGDFSTFLLTICSNWENICQEINELIIIINGQSLVQRASEFELGQLPSVFIKKAVKRIILPTNHYNLSEVLL